MRGQQIIEHVNVADAKGQKGLHFYIDRLYSNIPLAEEITSRGHFITATLDESRGVPPEVKISSKKPTVANPKGTVKAVRKGNTVVWCVMDNGKVYFIDTGYGGATYPQESKNHDGEYCTNIGTKLWYICISKESQVLSSYTTPTDHSYTTSTTPLNHGRFD